jgi:hypothetical protein
MAVVLRRASSNDADPKTARPFMADQESSMSSMLRSLASIGFKLHCFSSVVHFPELVYVFLRI